MTINMRIPTYKEWDEMMDVCHEDDSIVNWKGVYSWVGENQNRPVRGFRSARTWHAYHVSCRLPFLGFRPAFDDLPLDAPDNGAVKVIGTLYMDGIPVCIPDDALDKSCIPDYISGTKLEMREPLDDPQYQVQAIRVGDIYISDRVLLKGISYTDIVTAIAEADDTQADRGQCENRWLSIEIENRSMPTVCTHASKEAAVSYANAKLAKIIAQSDVFDSETYHKSDNTKQMFSIGYRNQNNRWDCYLMAETNIEILTQE